MATHDVLIANPTASAVTANSITVNAGQVAYATVDDTTTELYVFVDAGCAVASADASDSVDHIVQLAEKAINLLRAGAHVALSAGTDPHAAAGL